VSPLARPDPTMPLNDAQTASPSYRLPVEDSGFLLRPEMRGIRFQIEFAKADLMLRDWGVASTIIVFGSARMPSPEQAEGLAALLAPEDEAGRARLARHVAYYEAARAFGRIAGERGGSILPERTNVVATGGGPGIMEAANRGAHEAGAPSIGFNITLPMEQQPNAWSTPDLTFRFHYFAMRKMHLAMRANALVVFPGGFGTLDELFEIITLQQTGKAPVAPVVLYDEAYWRRLINFDLLVEEEVISPADLDLFAFADTPEAAWECLIRKGLQAHSAPQAASLD
jgi:uncharacterized protein (TIGR00730 family)